MGVSRQAYDEIINVVGHLPSLNEISTLLAMWQSNGCQQSLYGWLKGQHHAAERNTYLYEGDDNTHRHIKEPQVKECIAIARKLLRNDGGYSDDKTSEKQFSAHRLIYLSGNISTEFLDSEYGRRYLHITRPPSSQPTDNDSEYTDLILSALENNSLIASYCAVLHGGLFGSLIRNCAQDTGFDILTCREVRLDAFLFGEESGRFIVTLNESDEDLFLNKMKEARINCCFLGRTTKGRVLVDGMDFGHIAQGQ